MPVKWPPTLQWRYNERDGVSNHQHHDCSLNHLFKAPIKENIKARVTGLCEGNSPMTCEFPAPAQRASYADNVSIWWRHHEMSIQNPPYPPTNTIYRWLSLVLRYIVNLSYGKLSSKYSELPSLWSIQVHLHETFVTKHCDSTFDACVHIRRVFFVHFTLIW